MRASSNADADRNVDADGHTYTKGNDDADGHTDADRNDDSDGHADADRNDDADGHADADRNIDADGRTDTDTNAVANTDADADTPDRRWRRYRRGHADTDSDSDTDAVGLGDHHLDGRPRVHGRAGRGQSCRADGLRVERGAASGHAVHGVIELELAIVLSFVRIVEQSVCEGASAGIRRRFRAEGGDV